MMNDPKSRPVYEPTAGGPAFPVPERKIATLIPGQQQTERPASPDGMTLRDYFAAKALGPMVEKWYRDEDTTCHEIPMLARVAFQIADAMIAERAK